jgi:exonuclease SbcD
MPKFIIVGDIQFRGINPVARKDVFIDALAQKIDEINQLARQIGANAILTPGDLFDSPMVSYSVLIKLMTLLQMAPCPWVTIPGNHDLFGSNIDTYPRTPMAVLEQAQVITVLDQFPQSIPRGNNGVYITGRGFDWEMDTHPRTYAASVNPDIHLVHGMLVTSPLPYEIKHTLIKDVETEARVTICGHDHLGFGIIKRDDGKWFINPGALCRESAHEAEMKRQVQVCILEITKDDIKAELVPITCARPAEEVLSREHIEAAALRQERMDNFLDLLSQGGEGKFLEVAEIIAGITERESLPPAVKDEALRRISAAREELAGKKAGRGGVIGEY